MGEINDLLRGDSNEVDFALEEVRRQLDTLDSAPRNRVREKLVLAALCSITWIGGYLAAAAGAKLDDLDARGDSLRTQWLEGHRRKLDLLHETMDELVARLDGFGEMIDERIESEEYLALVRKAFRVWDSVDTDEKRKYASTLVTNAATTRLCSDDVVRLFIDWLDRYHQAHFAVIQYVYHHDGCTRRDIWTSIYGDIPRDDSAEADLFKRLIRDLNIDGRYPTAAGCYRFGPVSASAEQSRQAAGCEGHRDLIRGDQRVRTDVSGKTVCSLHHGSGRQAHRSLTWYLPEDRTSRYWTEPSNIASRRGIVFRRGWRALAGRYR